MLDNAIVVLYLCGILALGVWSGRGMKTLQHFSVGYRSYNWFFIFATLSASFIGGGFSIGNAEKVFLFGIVNVFALWGFSLKEILVARFIAPRMKNYPNAITVGDIMGSSYGKIGKIVTGVFAVALCAGITGAQVGGIGIVFNVFLGIDKIWGILIGCGIVITYSTLGGMRAVILTDVIQFAVLVIGIPLALLFGINHAGGWQVVSSNLTADHFSLLGDKHIFAFASLFLTFLLGETLVPPYVQRLLIGKNIGETIKGTYASGILSIFFFAITGAIGLVAYSLDSSIDANTALPFVIKTVLPIGLKGLVIVGVISIVMSSADSFLNAASVSLINDVVRPLRKTALSDIAGLRLTKATNLVVGLLSVIFAIKIPSMLDILIYAYNFWAPVILVPLALAILGFHVTRAAFLVGAISGIAGVFLWNGCVDSQLQIDGLVIGVFVNFFAFVLTTLISRKPARA